MKAKIKNLKVDLSKVDFADPTNVNDGQNGKILEHAMRKQGFPVDSQSTVDLPNIGVECKTRKSTSKSCHTVGTMTYDDIINTPWDDTPFKQKMQKQYRVEISKNDIDDTVSAKGKIVDFNSEFIQKDLREAYESCRSQLKSQGKVIPKQTLYGGKFGLLEHKPNRSGAGKSYAFRVTHSGMKALTNKSILTGLFDIG